MDYYEELGLKPTATEEDIRKAHRRLVKLFHPDQQTDEAMKVLAETQMRRLNAIAEVLCDPERRRLYDEQLRGFVPYGPPAAASVQSAPKRSTIAALPWWLASTLAAVALTVGAVCFWANNWGSSFNNNNNRAPVYIPSVASATDPPATRSAAPSASVTPSVSATTVQVENPRSEAPPSSPRTLTKVSVPGRSSVPAQSLHPKTLVLANGHLAASSPALKLNVAPPPDVQTASVAHPDPNAVPVAPLPPPAAPVEPSPPAALRSSAPVSMPMPSAVGPSAAAIPSQRIHQNPLEGEWVYVPSSTDAGRPGFYPPEFIDLKLFSNERGLHGEYRARYRITDRPIPPDVSFTLSPTGTNKFLWQAANGSRGTFKISSIDSNSIRVEWKTTVYSRGLALTAGTATLRKSQ